MKITLYKTTDSSNVINKKLTDKLEVDIKLKRTESYEQPRIILKNDNQKYKGYNYAYIEYFERYYFVETLNQNNNKNIELDLETDVLETYKEDILNSTGIITTTEKSSYLNSGVDVDVRKETEVYKSNITIPDIKQGVLVTIGGNENGK